MPKTADAIWQVIKMKVVYVLNIDVNILESLCLDHQVQFNEGATTEGGVIFYDEAIVGASDGCEDCQMKRGANAYKQAYEMEITKYDQPWSVDVAD
jgi:hypothetical protein